MKNHLYKLKIYIFTLNIETHISPHKFMLIYIFNIVSRDSVSDNIDILSSESQLGHPC